MQGDRYSIAYFANGEGQNHAAGLVCIAVMGYALHAY